MFEDEDLFTISIRAEGDNAKGVTRGIQTEPLEIADKETHTLTAINSVEVQADPNDIHQIRYLRDDEVDLEQLEGFLRSRQFYLTNTIKEYSVLQSSKRRIGLTQIIGTSRQANLSKQVFRPALRSTQRAQILRASIASTALFFSQAV